MKKQDGFSLVEGLLIILVLGLIGFAGYYVWNQQNGENSQNNNSEQQSTSNVENSNNPNESLINQNMPEVQSVTISELGLKINDPENRNFTLKKIDVEPPFEGPSTTYYTLTPQAYSENGFDKYCETTGFIRELDEDTADSYRENSRTVKDIDGRYYSISGTVGGCGDDKEGWYDFVKNNTQYISDNMEKL